MKAKKLRVSYSLLKLWQKGDYEGAVNYYFKLDPITSAAMEEGRAWDDLVCNEVNTTKKFPKEWGGEKVANPQTQLKLVVPYSDEVDLVGQLDIYDDPIIYELKTGSSADSGDYANDFQISIYFLLCELSGLNAEKAIIKHFNQMKQTLDQSMVWKSKNQIEKAKNFVEGYSPEIYQYFEEQGFI